MWSASDVFAKPAPLLLDVESPSTDLESTLPFDGSVEVDEDADDDDEPETDDEAVKGASGQAAAERA